MCKVTGDSADSKAVIALLSVGLGAVLGIAYICLAKGSIYSDLMAHEDTTLAFPHHKIHTLSIKN
jgi:hypothetical protein